MSDLVRPPGTARPTGIAPVMLVHDIAASVAYWREKIGFDGEVYGNPMDFAILRRGEARVCLSQCPAGHRVVPNWKLVPSMWDAYIWVDDADALYAELKQSGAIIDYEIGDKDYGCREFGIRDLENRDIAFGQVISQASGKV